MNLISDLAIYIFGWLHSLDLTCFGSGRAPVSLKSYASLPTLCGGGLEAKLPTSSIVNIFYDRTSLSIIGENDVIWKVISPWCSFPPYLAALLAGRLAEHPTPAVYTLHYTTLTFVPSPPSLRLQENTKRSFIIWWCHFTNLSYIY